jgi:hypothetical protein
LQAGAAPQNPVGAAPRPPLNPAPPADAGQAALPDNAQAAFDVSPSVPPFLQTAFIEVTSQFTATTYDFIQQQAAGRMTMEIRNWQRIGTLGWQSFQQFTADYQANDQQLTFVSPTGFTDTWTFQAVGPQGMDVIDSAGRIRNLFNCAAPGWPTLIALSTRSCSGF